MVGTDFAGSTGFLLLYGVLSFPTATAHGSNSNCTWISDSWSDRCG